MPLHAVDFAHFIVHNGVGQLVKEKTFASNFLDLLLVSDSLAVYNVSVGSPFSTSDPCIITWNTWFPLIQSNLSFTRHDFKRADLNMISQSLGSIERVNLFISISPNDIKGIVRQSICKNLMQKLPYKLHCLGRYVMPSRLTRKYHYTVIN